MTLYEKRIRRLHDAVAMRPVDKIPVSINGPAFVAAAQGVTLKEFITDFDRATQTSIDFMARLRTADSIQTPVMWPEGLSAQWMSKVSSPGFELGDNELWQVEEAEVIKYEDYQYILDYGFAKFKAEVLEKRLGVNMPMLQKFGTAAAKAAQKCAQAGVPVINAGGNVGTPFEPICGGRGLANFFIDLFDEPELLSRVFDEVMKCIQAEYAEALEHNADAFGAWVGGWRAAPSMLSGEMWEAFVWPYLKCLAMMTIERGLIPIFHLDSNWDRSFPYFKELPPRRYIISLDGTSDIRACRRVLGDEACIMGDVPASLLAFGSESEVYDYTKSLIDDVGPKTGLIISSGCDIPFNAKFENVRAMVDAAADYQV